MKHLDFKLGYKNFTWQCNNENVTLEAGELSDLDKQIKQYIVNNFEKGIFNINFYFDFADFPLWMRQYMPHYFNRNLIINTK